MKKLYEEENIAAIAEAIREKTGSRERYTPAEMAGGIDAVFAAGEKSQYDEFWDAFQNAGSRTDYENGFMGDCWDETTFKPKYDLKPVSARSMFTKFGKIGSGVSLAELLNRAGVSLDTSNVTMGRTMFSAFHGAALPPLVFNKATDLNSLFYDCLWLDNLDITLNLDKSANIAGMFGTCRALTNLTVHGTIAGTGVSLQWSTGLTKASFISVIRALSEETSGLSITFSKTAKEAAFTAEEWSALIGEKPNWTISLV